MYDIIILGGGWYGCKVALKLKELGIKNIVILEPNEELLSVATTVNQARIHQGFHYCRSVATAMTARKNYERFLIDHAPAIAGNTRHLYCIATEGSKVTPEQFEKVMDTIDAPYTKTYTPSYFAPGMIAQVYETHERSFDIEELRILTLTQLALVDIEIRQTSGKIIEWDDQKVTVQTSDNNLLSARGVINATYANLDQVGIKIRSKLRKEWVEVPLIQVPNNLSQDDLTIMNGSFWSLMEYPSHGGFSALTHVSLGRHTIWSPPNPQPQWNGQSNAEAMIRDASRFVPSMACAKYITSMYTIRTLLDETMLNDDRPILMEYAEETPRVVSILGSKFTSYYGILPIIEQWIENVILS
jgi:glycine/D-amino acid oxidase-like deaminating enzyme